MARLKGEAGFTLTELLIVAAILAFAMAAVVGIFQVTQRSTFFASAGEEAQLSARAILDQLARELRMINFGRSTTAGGITAASTTSITFLGDVDNDTRSAGNDATVTALADSGATTVQVSSGTGFSVGEQLSVADGPISETQSITAISGTTVTLGAGLSTYYPAGSIARSVETVTYTYTAPTSPGTVGTLTRTAGGTTETLADNISSFQLTYWNASTPPAQITDLTTQASRDQIREIRIQITTRSRAGDQTVSRTMEVAVRPRNLF
jgi:prepilin-type N-terminal cleavage/methylation domain-containing protein